MKYDRREGEGASSSILRSGGRKAADRSLSGHAKARLLRLDGSYEESPRMSVLLETVLVQTQKDV